MISVKENRLNSDRKYKNVQNSKNVSLITERIQNKLKIINEAN